MDEEMMFEMSAGSLEGLPSVGEMFDLMGKVAVVSGTIGLALNVIYRLASCGAKVVFGARRELIGQQVEEHLKGMGFDVRFFKFDTRNVEECRKLVAFAEEVYGTVDIVVPVAASFFARAFVDITEDEYDRIVDVDQKGQYFLVQAAARSMIRGKKGGKVVTVASVAYRSEGIVLERGFLAPEMTTNEEKTAAELDDPRILLCDSKLDNVQEILPMLIACAEDGYDLLIICEGLSGDARSTILRTDMDGEIKIVCIEAPLYGDGRRWRMEDLAVQLGATYFQKALNMDLRSAKREDFGTAAHARVTKQQTVISGPGGDKAAVEARVRELRYLAANEDYEFNRKRHQESLAQLSSGVATIHAGGRTQTELWERKLRLEDAVHAAQAAQLEGVVPGGGTALVRLIPAVKSCASTLRGDEKTGALAVIHALEAPVRQIAENAGQDGRMVAAKLRGLSETVGYDAGTDRFTDMVQAGILDPVRVTRTALQSALSVSASMLTTEACITGNDQRTEA